MMFNNWFPNDCNNIGLVCIDFISKDEDDVITNPHSIYFDDSSDMLFIEDKDGD